MIRKNKKTWACVLSCLILFLAGCASEISENKTFDEIENGLKNKSNPLEIYENTSIRNEDASVYEDAEAKKTESSFGFEKGTGVLVNPNVKQVSRGAAANEPGVVTLNFENADIREVIKFIMTDLLHENYILSPQVGGTVSLQTSRPVAKSDLLPTLETLLSMNGAVMLRGGGLIRILPQAEANKGNLTPGVGAIKTLKAGYQVRIIPLKYITAEEAQKNLEPFLPDGSLLNVDTTKNILTVAGTSEQLANIQQIIDTFDVDWLKGMSIGVYKLKNVALEDVMPELEGLFGASGDTPFAGLFKFVAMERMNSVMIITPQKNYLTEAQRWLEKLDQSENSNAERLYVYRVKNGRAEDLESVLAGIFESDGGGSSTSSSTRNRSATVAEGLSGSSVSSRTSSSSSRGLSNSNRGLSSSSNSNSRSNRTSSGSSNGSSGSSSGSSSIRRSSSSGSSGSSSSSPGVADAVATISADTVNNSLVIKATPQNYDQVLQALRQLDVPKLQVLLDVVIAEISLTGELQYGFKYFLQDEAASETGDASQGFEIGQLAGVTGGFNYTLDNVSGKINAQIDLLAKKGLAQFLSTPSLMVLDNETATMQVGESIAIEGESIVNDGGTVSSNDYLDTGVELEVTPRVNASGNVILDITQSTSRQSGVTAASGNPNVFDRSITSSVSAKDGQTIVLGGLIQEQNSSDRGGVPYLMDVPLIGSLFRSTGKSNSRTELIVLVTPRVARNAEESLRITKEFRAKMHGLDIYNRNKEKN